MRKTIAKLLIVASTLLFVVAFTACSSNKHDDLPPYPSIATLDISDAMDYPTTAFDTNIAPLETTTATLEQIIDHTRLAMGDIVTYKTRGTSVDRDSTGESRVSSHHFTEFHSYDRYRFGEESPENEGDQFIEWLVVGSRVFSRNSDPKWQELEPFTEFRTPTPPSQGFLSFLYEGDIKLLSTNELTDDGKSVYRIGFIENFDPPYSESDIPANSRQYLVHSYEDSYLIDAESFRILSRTTAKLYKSNFFDESSNDPGANFEWYETLRTEHYFDYNEPVVIEVPVEYVPWSDTAVLSFALDPEIGPARAP